MLPSQNWFRTAAGHVVSGNKSKAEENNGIRAEVRNGATTGKKRGRKPKERLTVDTPPQIDIEALTQNTALTVAPPSGPAQSPALVPDCTDGDFPHHNRQPAPSTPRRSKPKRPFLE